MTHSAAHTPTAVENTELAVRTVAIIGAGALGRALAQLSLAAGFRTVLEDVLPSKLRRAAGELAQPSAPPAGLLLVNTVEDAAREADLILDSVPDELESKLEIFSMLDRMAPPRTVLLTPTRELSIADLASCTYRPERCLSFTIDAPHGESWPPGTAVSVVRTAQTLSEVVHAVVCFWQAAGLTPEVQLDAAPGEPL